MYHGEFIHAAFSATQYTHPDEKIETILVRHRDDNARCRRGWKRTGGKATRQMP